MDTLSGVPAWPEGTMRAHADSPTVPYHDSASPDKMFKAPAKTEGIHCEMLLARWHFQSSQIPANQLRQEAERRLVYQLVDFGLKNGVWPTNPTFRWEQYLWPRGWRPFLWMPDPNWVDNWRNG